MSKKLFITIPDPCSQDWDSFEPQSGGRFCGSCQKTVIDFTKMSDQELFDYFKTQKNQVCGRFNPNQIDRIFNLDSNKKSIFKIKSLILSFIGLLMSFAIKAQTIDSLKTKQAVEITPMPFKSSITENKTTDQKRPFELPDNHGMITAMGGASIKGIHIETIFEKRNYNNIIDYLK